MTKFNSSVNQFEWSRDGHVFAATSGRHIYDLWLSSNDGADWTYASARLPNLFQAGEPNLGRAGVRQVLRVAGNNANEFYVATWTTSIYHTTDGGLSFERFDSLSSDSKQPIFVDGISPNPFNSSIMIGSTFVIQSIGISYAALCISYDGARTWTIVEDRVGQYGWLDPDKHKSATNYTVLYLSFPGDPSLRKNGLLLSVTNDAFQSASIDLLDNVVEIVAATDGRLLVAQYKATLRFDDLALLQSNDDGRSWTHVHVPNAFDNSTFQSRFGVVEQQNGATLLKRHIGDSTWQAQLLRGRRLDSEFRVALDGVRSVIRRPGVARIYSVDDTFVAEHFEDDGALRALISFDGAVTWERLARNLSLFVQDFYPDCQTLQCGDLISRSDAPGIATGVGTHGNLTWELSGLPVPLETYTTRDGGHTWAEALPFSTVQAISARANTIVFARNRVPTTDLHFSHDFGATVQACRLFESNVTVINIEASPRDARQFAVFASDGTFALVDFDAAGAAVRDCVAADFEPVQLFEGCALGSRTTMWRRRANANCVQRDAAPPVQRSPCPCQRSDFECDECYNTTSNGQCVPDWQCLATFRGIDRATNAPVFCEGEFEQSRGFARIVNNVCVDSKQQFDPIMMPCPTEPPTSVLVTVSGNSDVNATTVPARVKSGCCVAHSDGGCNVPTVESCVCRADATCCSLEWDASCTSLALGRCRAQCARPTLRPKMPRRTPPPVASSTARDGLSGGAIAGIVIVAVAVVVLIGLLTWCVVKRRRSRGYARHNES